MARASPRRPNLRSARAARKGQSGASAFEMVLLAVGIGMLAMMAIWISPATTTKSAARKKYEAFFEPKPYGDLMFPVERGTEGFVPDLQTQLCRALVDNNDVNVARRLLKEEGADPSEPHEFYPTTSPIFLAAFKGRFEAVQLLLEHGVDADKGRSDDGATPMYMAAQEGHIKIVKLLLTHKVNPNKKHVSSGKSPITIAATKGHCDVVKMLLEYSADPNIQTVRGDTAVLIATEAGHLDIVKVLLEHGANPNIVPFVDVGATPLFYAAELGHTEIVKVLLQHNADPTATWPDNGDTPITAATKKGHVEIVKLLLEYKSNPNHRPFEKENDGPISGSPLFNAAERGDLQIVNMLIENGADINNGRPHDGYTPVLAAAAHNHTEVVEVLLKHNCSVNDVGRYGLTALGAAAGRGYIDIVKLLLSSNADVNQVMSEDLATPVFIATQNEHVEVAAMLLEHNADPNMSRSDGFTPLYITTKQDHVGLATLLLQHNADPNITMVMRSEFTILAQNNHSTRFHDYIVSIEPRADAGLLVDLAESSGTLKAVNDTHKIYVKEVVIALYSHADPHTNISVPYDRGGDLIKKLL